jgi:hypothetical protein
MDVSTGAEVPTLTGEQHDPDRGIGVTRQNRLVQRLQQFDIEPVGHLWSIQA